jgi:hypothetical protein
VREKHPIIIPSSNTHSEEDISSTLPATMSNLLEIKRNLNKNCLPDDPIWTRYKEEERKL